LWKTLRKVPWRPGFREAERVASLISRTKVAVLAYLWAERWANYFGSLAGQLDLLRRRRLTA
jgi:hypothetical protein